MNRVQSMFGRHFSTTAGAAVETATSQAGNYGFTDEVQYVQFTEVCRVVNTYNDGPKDAVRAFRKRLMGNKDLTQVSVSVGLLQFCVNNLDFNFHALVASRDFAGEVLVRLLNPKTQQLPIIEERVLSIIKMLAEAYSNTVVMSEICNLYHELLSKGHEFPRVKPLKLAPTQNRRSSSGGQVSRERAGSSTPTTVAPSTVRARIVPPTQPVHLNREQLGKLRKDISVVEGNIRVFSEMLTEIDPSADSYDLQLMGELNRTCRAMQQRIVELIGQVLNEEMTIELLRINDDLNNIFLRYERFERYRTKQPGSSPEQTANSTAACSDHTSDMVRPSLQQQQEPPPSYSDTEHLGPAVSNDLIDLGFDPVPPPPPPTTYNVGQQQQLPSTSAGKLNDFSMLSLNDGGGVGDMGSMSAHPPASNGDLSDQLASFTGNQDQLAEVKEIEQWLASDQQFGSSSAASPLMPPQLPSRDEQGHDDFSAFLSERAAASGSSTAPSASNYEKSSQKPSLL